LAQPKSPDPQAISRDRVSREVSSARTLGLIKGPEMAKGIETNLELLDAHYAIVAAALDKLEGESR